MEKQRPLLRSPERKREALGATARIGPRTGAAVIPWQTSEAIVDVFLKHFSNNCTDDRIKPPSTDQIVTGGVAFLPDLATGQTIPVEVVLAPSSGAFHVTSLPATGMWQPMEQRITISPTRGACKPPASWRNILLSTVRHELTHAADPGLHKKNQRMIRFQRAVKAWAARGGPSSGLPLPKLTSLPKSQRAEAVALLEAMATGQQPNIPKSRCEYVRNPYEARAFLTQVISEVELVGAKLKADPKEASFRFKTPAAALRAASPTFREIEGCLTSKGKRKYLRAAARVWDAGAIPK